jgi:hypothetical protein
MYPHRVSTVWRDYFYSTAGIAAWTLEIARDGANVANTGFAVAEVDAVNNDGLYAITATAAAFATTGSYDVTAYETATPTNRFSFSVRVTSDGTFEGAAGAISWTASSGDGRVTDGTSALDGATVRLLNTDNAVLQEASTDSAGLATLLLTDDTSYNLVVSKTGYVNERVSSGLIVSSSQVITSPGADIALTADSTSSESIVFADLVAYARRQKLNASSEQSTTEIKEAVNEALFWLAGEYPWPNLCEEYQLTIYAPYSTGTIAVSSGTATILGTGTVFPSWADDALLLVDDVFLEVDSRDSDTQLTLSETWDAASLTGESYSLYRCEYDKPAGLLGIQRFLSPNADFNPVSDVTMAQRRVSRDSATRSGFDYNLSNGLIRIWPCPTTTTVYKYIGRRRPTTLVSDDDVADWDPSLLSVLRRAVDWQLAIRGQCKAGDVAQTWTTLQLAVENAWGAMQDHRDQDYNQSSRDESDLFDGTMSDF